MRHVISTRTAQRGAAVAAIALTTMLPGGERAEAERVVTPGAAIEGTWTLSVGGLTAAELAVDGGSSGGRYRVKATIETIGMVRPFLKAGIEAEVYGKVSRIEGHGGLAPQRYRSRTEDTKRTRNVAMRYTRSGPDVTVDPAYSTKDWSLDPATQTDALDPLSAILSAFGAQPAAALCNREVRVFDARRRYAVRLGAPKPGAERGTITCEAEYRRLGGFKPKLLRKPPYRFTVTFKDGSDGLWHLDSAAGDTPYGSARLARKG